jgi:hypothetical protein
MVGGRSRMRLKVVFWKSILKVSSNIFVFNIYLEILPNNNNNNGEIIN